ncbi:MAG: nitrile hydratase subunit beta [Hyphomicrobiaceae bacterium]
MDGMHDLGGMHGFGRVTPEENEPVFHADWERRMFALASAAPFAVGFGDDQFRPGIEAMPPARYLSSSYYEKWLFSVTRILEARGLLTEAELAGEPASTPSPTDSVGKPVGPGLVIAAIWAGASQERPDATDAPMRFGRGERVRTRSTMPDGHNRLPRYARDRTGTIERIAGRFLVADRNAVGIERPEALYTVVFSAEELWGDEARAGDTLSLDLWDSYLEPAP